MRHAARQTSHGFHLGRLLELHLQAPPLADVAHDGHEAKHLPGIACDGEHRKLDLFFTAGLGPDACFLRLYAPGQHRLPVLLEAGFPYQQVGRVAAQFFDGILG